MRRLAQILLTTVFCISVFGCASADSEATSQNDPFENTNRVFFSANMRLDKYIARPVAKFYVSAFPSRIRVGVHNVLETLGKPVVLGNDVLQGEFTRAGQTLTRFVTNSTLGLAGLIDVATMAGVPDHSEDFGQTLAVWGVGEGPYLFLPLLGPSNPRDFIGKGADYFINPTLYAHFEYENLANDSKLGFGIVDARSRALDASDQLERTSLDYYAAMRSLYRQYRKAQIANGDPDAPPPDDDPLDEKN